MKKLITIALAIVMVATMSLTAFAAETKVTLPKDEKLDTEIDVTAKYTNTVETPDVISVDVVWGAMEFTYTVGGTKDWNATNHTYTENFTPTWTAEGNTVKVTNHSNVAVTAAFAYAAVEGSAVTGTLDKTEATELAAGVEGKADEAANVTATLTLGGTLAETQTELAKVGAITVTIAKKA